MRQTRASSIDASRLTAITRSWRSRDSSKGERIVVGSRRIHEAPHLLLDSGNPVGVPVADRVDGNASSEVEELPPVGAEELGAFAVSEDQIRRAAVCLEHVAVLVGDNLEGPGDDE